MYMDNTADRRISIIAIVLGILVIAMFAYVFLRPAAVPTPAQGDPAAGDPSSSIMPAIEGDTASLVAISIEPGEVLSGARVVTGTLTGAYFFEANARGALLDANKNVLKEFPITATTDWMTAGPVAFTFTADASGVPAGAGYLRIANDNPSGDPALDKHIDIPVVFQ